MRGLFILATLALAMAVGPAQAKNIVETAKADGSFTTLLAANNAAGTTPLLEGNGPFTIFAPNDAAFAKVPPAKLSMLMNPANKTMLKGVLSDHVVTGILSMAQLDKGLVSSDAVTVMAANNMPLIFKLVAGKLTVNGANIIEGPIKVDNGLIYVVDTVLLPAMPLQPQY